MDQLRKQIGHVLAELKDPALVEEYIDGREINVPILPGETPSVLPITEIEFGDLPPHRRYMDYNLKWPEESATKRAITRCPALLSGEEQRTIADTALRCYTVLGLDSYARVDIRFRDNIPYVLEINQNPSIGEDDCGYVRSCNSYGLDYTGMIDAILQNAIGRSK